MLSPGSARVAVFDLQGHKVIELLSGAMAPGAHHLTWDGRDHRGRRMPAGVYLVRAESAKEVASQRVILVQ